MVSAYPEPNSQDKHKVQHEDRDVYGVQRLLGEHIPLGSHRRWGAAGGLHGFWCGRALLCPDACICQKKRVGWLGAGAGWGQHRGGAGCFLGCSALAGLWGCGAAGAGAVEVAPVPGARPHSLIPLVRDVPDAARIRTLGVAEFLPSREMGALQRGH